MSTINIHSSDAMVIIITITITIIIIIIIRPSEPTGRPT
jgi:hypothetical protein